MPQVDVFLVRKISGIGGKIFIKWIIEAADQSAVYRNACYDTADLPGARPDGIPSGSVVIVLQIAFGDQKARLQVYKLFYKTVFSNCLQIVSDTIGAETLMHESFLIAFKNINSYSGDISFSSWIKKFIKDACQYLNICKKR
jgi:hypothetical protein